MDGGSAGTWASRRAAGVISVSASAPPCPTPDTKPVATAEARAATAARASRPTSSIADPQADLPGPRQSDGDPAVGPVGTAGPADPEGTPEAATDETPAAGPWTSAASEASADPVSENTRLLLRLLVANQEREQRHLCDVFHDGPIQDFTAVLLACSTVRRTLAGPEAERLADVETQLHNAIATLRLPSPAFRASNDARMILESALASRVRGPLARTLETVLEVDDPAPTRAEVAELLGAVQLLLLESDPLRPAAHAAVAIRSGHEGMTLTLRATPDPISAAASPDAARDASARTDRLGRVAALTGAQIIEETPGGSWRASLAWPRPAPRPPVVHTRIEQRPGLAAYQHRPAGDRDGTD
ncbi:MULTISPECIES: hypothetical protein [unclassified Pseudofrankia]|uniref:hypothetical protein n=1 Tax=unclassified Pseudofrankia TaxID=2994372 RepID=UPI001041DD55|nr:MULTISPECIES: hypothetical protein [unclassified Pseudofrankia]MDT3439603.1 hypothetical protein [Pseudofrankia sp. BMG5.37]